MLVTILFHQAERDILFIENITIIDRNLSIEMDVLNNLNVKIVITCNNKKILYVVMFKSCSNRFSKLKKRWFFLHTIMIFLWALSEFSTVYLKQTSDKKPIEN